MTKYKLIVDGEEVEDYDSFQEAKVALEETKEEAFELSIDKVVYKSTYHGKELDGSDDIEYEEMGRQTILSMELNEDGEWE